MKLKYKVKVIILLIALAIVSVVGRSYALWVITEKQNDSNLIIAGCFSVTLNDKDINNLITRINLTSTYPISDERGMNLTQYYELKVKNTCSVAASYKVTINSLNTNTLDDSFIKYYLVSSPNNYGPSLLESLDTYLMEDSMKSTIETKIKQIENNNDVAIKNSYLLSTGVLNPTEEKTYELRMWVRDDATSEQMSKEFKATVALEAYATANHS